MRTISFIIALTGILATCGLFKGVWRWSSWMYYTIQSNVLIILLFGYLVIASIKSIMVEGKKGEIKSNAHFEMVCMIDIFLTFLVYWTMLAPQIGNIWKYDNVIVHGITPLLCIFDYYLFIPRKRLTYKDVYLSLIFPLSYVGATTVAGFLGYRYSYDRSGKPVHFPYFFMDYDRIGWRALYYILGLSIFIIIISYIVYRIDRKVVMAGPTQKK